MKIKLKNGMEVDLHDEDMKSIYKMYKDWNKESEEFDFDEMTEYFKDLHKHAIHKMEMISGKVITDEDSLDIAMEYVAKNGTYHDFVKMLRYMADYNTAYHSLESFKK